MKLLLIEDNVPLARWLSGVLRRTQSTVDRASDGEFADILLLTQHCDVVLLDLQLLTLSGQGVLQRLRGRRNPVLMLTLTVSGGVGDKITCLGAGTDNYLVESLEIRELVTWTRVLTRRSMPNQSVELQCDDLMYHTDSRTFSLAGQLLALPTRGHTMLGILVLKLGHTMSKPALVNGVFGMDSEAGPEAIGIYIHHSCKELEHSAAIIVTLRNLGYLLCGASTT